jgi:hypothetical protein
VNGEHDRSRLGRLTGGFHLGRRHRKNDIDIHADQLSRQLTQLLDRLRPPELNDDVFAIDIAQLAQAGQQRLDPVALSRGVTKP